MDKYKRHCPPLCDQHVFSLSHPSKPKLNVVMHFCPKYYRPPRLPEQTCPVFNTDGHYFTSAFILQVDQRVLAHNENQELADHNKHVRDALEKTGRVAFPRPNKKYVHCAVCREKYSNYYSHIMSE
jgi:hypothetical protein